MRKASVVVGDGDGDDASAGRDGACQWAGGGFIVERGRWPGRKKRMSPFRFAGVDEIEPSCGRGAAARVNFILL